jgi:hypothetical protein
MSLYRVKQELKDRTTLLGAGGDLRFKLCDPIEGFQQSPLQVGNTLCRWLQILPFFDFRQPHGARKYPGATRNARSKYPESSRNERHNTKHP